jgi:hypothetical protein
VIETCDGHGLVAGLGLAAAVTLTVPAGRCHDRAGARSGHNPQDLGGVEPGIQQLRLVGDLHRPGNRRVRDSVRTPRNSRQRGNSTWTRPSCRPGGTSTRLAERGRAPITAIEHVAEVTIGMLADSYNPELDPIGRRLAFLSGPGTRSARTAGSG